MENAHLGSEAKVSRSRRENSNPPHIMLNWLDTLRKEAVAERLAWASPQKLASVIQRIKSGACPSRAGLHITLKQNKMFFDNSLRLNSKM